MPAASQRLKKRPKDHGKSYKCDICGKTLTTWLGHSLHIKQHTEMNSYKCKTCGQSFPQAVNLRNHEMLHTGERPFRCTYCGQGFIEARSLKRHVMSHTGERPYKCETCGKGFKESAKRNRHFNTVHVDSRAFKCELCDKCYGDKSSLSVHMRVHSKDKGVYRKYICDICGLALTTKPVLRRHILRKHKSEQDKPKKAAVRYNCSYCPKTYAYSWDLKRHEESHTDPNIYSCQCGSVFDIEKSLKTHMKTCKLDSKTTLQKLRTRDPKKRLTQFLKAKKLRKNNPNTVGSKNTDDCSTDGYDEIEPLNFDYLVPKEEGRVNCTITGYGSLVKQERYSDTSNAAELMLGQYKGKEDPAVIGNVVIKEEPITGPVCNIIPMCEFEEPIGCNDTNRLDPKQDTLDGYVSSLLSDPLNPKIREGSVDEFLDEFLLDTVKREVRPPAGAWTVKSECSSCQICIAGFVKVSELENHYLYDH